MTIADELEKLEQLKARGVLSAEEFEAQKKRVLEGPGTPQYAPSTPAPQPRIEVPFANPRTGERKSVKVGFAWDVALLATLLGIPLFLRGLNIWGGICLVLWTVNFFVSGGDPATTFLLGLFLFAFQVWLATKANEFTAKNLLEQGWGFAEPDSEATKHGMRDWQLGSRANSAAPAPQPAANANNDRGNS